MILRVVWDPTRKMRLTRGRSPGYSRALPWLHEGGALVTRGPCPGYTRALPWFFRAVDIKVRHSGMLLAGIQVFGLCFRFRLESVQARMWSAFAGLTVGIDEWGSGFRPKTCRNDEVGFVSIYHIIFTPVGFLPGICFGFLPKHAGMTI